MGVQTLIRHRPAPTDDFGDPTGPPDDETYEGCDVWPRGSKEDAGRSATVVTGYTAIVYDQDADIEPGDRIEWDGDDYFVEGRPGKWRFLDGTWAGWQIALSFEEG